VPGFDRLWTDCIQEETWLESRDGLKRSHDEKFSLSSQERKGKFKKISSGESTAQDGKKKKDMRKFKCFACHKFGHYAGKCPHRKKGGNKTQSEVVVSTKAQVDEFCKKFEQTEFLLVSQTLWASYQLMHG
jgi:hypothetical protein